MAHTVRLDGERLGDPKARPSRQRQQKRPRPIGFFAIRRTGQSPQLVPFLWRRLDTRTTRHGTPKIQNIVNQMLTYVDQPEKSCLVLQLSFMW